MISLRGGDLDREEGVLVLRGKVKGGDYVGREVRDPNVLKALLDYLEACGRMIALETHGPPLDQARSLRATGRAAHLTPLWP